MNFVPGLMWFRKKDVAKQGIKKALGKLLKRDEILRGKGNLFTPVSMTIGWPQGLMHNISSFVHILKGLSLQKLSSRIITPDSKVLYLEHSDDGNESISFKNNVPDRKKA